MHLLPLLADTAVRTPAQKRAWLVTVILAFLVVFLLLLFGLLVLRLMHRGRRRQMTGAATQTGSAWEASADRVQVPAADDGGLPPDGPLDGADEPFWDVEDVEGEPEEWDEGEEEADGDGDDEPWR